MTKKISDPVHGLINLSKVEAELLATKSLQRLNNIHQLGLASLVYPGANYTRYAHSIGVCHNAARIFTSIRNNNPDIPIESTEEQYYRIVSLLHDVGHYPFSHATEHVIKDHFTENKVISRLEPGSQLVGDPLFEFEKGEKPYYDHEQMGAFIILHDKEIGSVLKSNGISAQEIHDRFMGSKPEYDRYGGIFSSDLDCDRLDYLRRTAISAGAPFGTVDIDFLIDQATIDSEGKFCFKEKAARAADHLLVSRVYDYMQVPFNKTAVSLEWSLTECLKILFNAGIVDPSREAMERRLNVSGEWYSFDDYYIISEFRRIYGNSSDIKIDDMRKRHFQAVLERKPAKLLFSWDEFREREVSNLFISHKKIQNKLDSIVDEFCRKTGRDRNNFNLWQCTINILKGETYDALEDNEYYKDVVYIKNENSRYPLALRKDAIIRALKEKYYSGIRLYYMPVSAEDITSDIKVELMKELTDPELRPI